MNKKRLALFSIIYLLSTTILLVAITPHPASTQSEPPETPSHIVGTVGYPLFTEVNLEPYGQNGYDYRAKGETFTWYVRAHSNWGDCNKFSVVYEGVEYYLIFQPVDYCYRDRYGANDYISFITDVIGIVEGNKITYPYTFPQVNLTYKTYMGIVKEEFTVKQLVRSPADWLTPPITLDFGGYIKFPNLKIYVNGEEKTTDFTTSSKIEFGLSSQQILFYLPEPYAIDATGNKINCTYEVKKQGDQIWFYIRTPYTWLTDPQRTFPITIDPSIVGTSATAYATSYPHQRKIFYDWNRSKLFWAFYSDGTNMVYQTSTDGVSWSSPTTVRACSTGYYFSVFFSGTYIDYAYAAVSSIYYRRGIPNSNGTITWVASEQVVSTTYNQVLFPVIAVDSNGYVWIGYRDGTYYPYVIRSGKNDGTWGTTPSGFPYQLSTTSSSGWRVSVVPLTGGKMLIVYARSATTISVRSWSGTSWNTAVSTTSSCRNGHHISVVAEGDDAHIVFLKSSGYDILHVKYTYSTNSLSSEHTVIAGASEYSAPVLSRDPATGTLYCFWATKTSGSPSGAVANHIYYQTSSDGGNTWSSPTDWIDESTEELYSAESLTCFYQSYGDYIGLMYLTKTESPFNVKFAYLSLAPPPQLPTIGGFQAPATVYANRFFFLNATVNHPNGVSYLKNATIDINNGVVLKWDASTNTFSKHQDTYGYCTLDSSGSIRTQINTTAYRLSWRIKLSWSFPEGYVSIVSANTKVFDINGYSSSNSQPNLFYFEDDLIIASATVDDNRVNPLQSITFTGIIYYYGTTTPPEDPSGITVYVQLGGTNKGSTTTIVSGAFSITINAEATVGLYTYNIYCRTDENSVQNRTVNVIVDRIKVDYYYVSKSRANINDLVDVDVKLIYEYDGTPVTTGTITINGIQSTHIGSGIYRITVSYPYVTSATYNMVAGSESTYGLNTVNQNGKSATVIWDRVNINVFLAVDSRINVGDTASFTVSGIYEYDSTPWSGTYTLNDTTTKTSVGKYGYRIISITDSNYGLTAFRQTAPDVYVIFDQLSILIIANTTSPPPRGYVNFTIIITYCYDGLPATASVIILRDGVPFATGNFIDGGYENETHTYTVGSAIDYTYGLTSFTSNMVTVYWGIAYPEEVTPPPSVPYMPYILFDIKIQTTYITRLWWKPTSTIEVLVINKGPTGTDVVIEYLLLNQKLTIIAHGKQTAFIRGLEEKTVAFTFPTPPDGAYTLHVKITYPTEVDAKTALTVETPFYGHPAFTATLILIVALIIFLGKKWS